MPQSKKCPEFRKQSLWKRVVRLKYWVSALIFLTKTCGSFSDQTRLTYRNSKKKIVNFIELNACMVHRDNIKRSDEKVLHWVFHIHFDQFKFCSLLNQSFFLCFNTKLNDGKIMKSEINFNESLPYIYYYKHTVPPCIGQVATKLRVNQVRWSNKTVNKLNFQLLLECYLTIIPRARMGSESIAHEAEGRMGYWLRGHEGERNNCFSKIQVVGQKNIETKHLALVKARF